MGSEGYQQIVETRYFRVIEVANGVYAALERENQETGSNAAFVDLGGRVVVFDTFLNLDAAVGLRAVAKQVCGREPAYVVNSHLHLDHVVGNQAFSQETMIVSSQTVRELMMNDTAETLAAMQSYDQSTIHRLEQAILTEQDPEKLAHHKNSLKFLTQVMRPDLHLRFPDVTFTSDAVIYGRDTELRMSSVAIAHSPGDVYGYLPQEKVCLAGDLLFAGEPPWIGAGNPLKFLEALEHLLQLDVDCLIPGHGPLATKADVQLQADYLGELLTLARERWAAGRQDLTRQDFSPQFRAWGGPSFKWNIDWIFQWLDEAK